ncbi:MULTISPECIES: hypothetical protein [Serratia]|uniref:hypothetical protein n=1 Tax=Serratia TaxID=613 RepID=UPI0019D13B26|nr:hypothetical protein [Serratia marcescens]QSD84966.1 hypothetical protein JMM80_13210 [Serratia marcescens]QSD86482.1 hypothetical protein JMM80_21590 [Serratia marcescens]WLS17461.1 hypothetical protein RAA91_14930 [Serratia marcescens]HCB1447931.1 hypothetical protein [Serratia marcescens]HCB1485585.1 hypothetical protein [Serratia marcescens]
MKTVVNTSDNTNSTKNTNSPNTQQFLMMPYELLSVHEVNGQRFDINMKVAYQYIKGFQDNGQQAYFSRAKLGEMLDIKELAVTRMMNKMIDCGLVNRIERSGYTNLYTVNPIEQNDTAAKSVAEEVKNESGPTVGNKAQSVKHPNSPTESTPENTHDARPVGIDDSHSAEPEQPAQPSQLPPVVVEEQPTEAEEPVEAEEEEEEPDFNSYAAMAAPVALFGWVTTHNATVELKAAYEAHRNTYGESHSIPSYAHHTPSYSTAEYDAGEAF